MISTFELNNFVFTSEMLTASLMAYISASLPEATKRTFLQHATASQIASANSIPLELLAKKVSRLVIVRILLQALQGCHDLITLVLNL